MWVFAVPFECHIYFLPSSHHLSVKTKSLVFKRDREEIMAIEAQLYAENLGFPMFGSSQQQQQQLQEGLMMMDNNGGFDQFFFDAQQKLPQPLQYLPPPMNPHVLVPARTNHNSNNFMAYTRQSIIAQEAKQRQEIDEYLRLQNERLRLMLQEQRKQHVSLLLKKIEFRTQELMRQKDEEIAQAMKNRMELEDFLRNMEAENQAWQRVAQENEAMIMSLNNSLEHFRDRATLGAMEQDAESCCDSKQDNDEEEEDLEFSNSVGVGGEEEIKTMVCKGCNSERACVLFLPCRHLCSCIACEAGLDACPVCSTPKKACIEALMF